MAATKLVRRMFFLIPKNVTSERPIARMPTLRRWWEASKGIELSGMLMMVEMEELNEPFGKF